MRPLDLLSELAELGTLESASLAWLELQPQGADEELVPLEGTAKQINYAEALRLEFMVRQFRDWQNMVWLANAESRASWWITVGLGTKNNPLIARWVILVLWCGRLAAED
jgi:hypothetical protein